MDSRIATNHDASPLRSTHKSEVALLLVILAVGIGLRVAWPGRIAVEHFDEGVYASNLFFDADRDYQYPFRYLYAPPLLPTLIEWTLTFTKAWQLGPALPSLFFGSVMIALSWWVARRWFDATTGLVAATLIATSDLFVIYSRLALTDVMMTFFLLASLYWIWLAMRKPSSVHAIVAGLLGGLTWWTKYNGWLPLAIGIVALAGTWFIRWRSRKLEVESVSTPRAFRQWVVVAIVAAVCWLPVYLSLQTNGGYAAVAANHRGYVVGFTGWFGSLMRQYQNTCVLEGGLSVGGIFLGVLVSLSSQGRQAVRGSAVVLTAATCLAAAASLIGGFAIWTLVSVVYAMVSIYRLGTSPLPSQCPLAIMLVNVWLLSLLLATPFYTAYPRLLLPALAAQYIVAASAVTTAVQTLRRGPLLAKHRWRVVFVASTGVALAILVWQTPRLNRAGIPGWQSRAPFRLAAQDLARFVSDRREESVVLVYGDPALFYQLRVHGVAAEPVAYVPRSIPTAATVYLAATTRNMPPDWHAAPLWTAEVTFSDVVKLNQHGTAPFTRLDSVQLWQLSPTGETP